MHQGDKTDGNLQKATTWSTERITVQGDYKWCERLHKVIGNKVTDTQIWNAQSFKEQLKIFLSRMRDGMSVIFVWTLLSYQ
jgi:hypothetical protein